MPTLIIQLLSSCFQIVCVPCNPLNDFCKKTLITPEKSEVLIFGFIFKELEMPRVWLFANAFIEVLSLMESDDEAIDTGKKYIKQTDLVSIKKIQRERERFFSLNVSTCDLKSCFVILELCLARSNS